MRTKIRKSGKGASLRRPAEIAEAARDAYDVEALIAGRIVGLIHVAHHGLVAMAQLSVFAGDVVPGHAGIGGSGAVVPSEEQACQER